MDHSGELDSRICKLKLCLVDKTLSFLLNIIPGNKNDVFTLNYIIPAVKNDVKRIKRLVNYKNDLLGAYHVSRSSE